MKLPFPPVEMIRTVLGLATQAPSIYNTQPWRWRVSDASIDLYCDPNMHLHAADPDGRDLVLSCGATLNHCVIAFAALGWHTTVTRLPDPADPDHLASIEVHPHPPEPEDTALTRAITVRRTDRRHYSSRPVPIDDIQLMQSRAAQLEVILRPINDRDKLKPIVLQAVSSHAIDYDYLVEVTTWSGRYDSRAGVPARNVPPTDPKALIPGRVFAAPSLPQTTHTTAADDHAAILVLGTDDDDRRAWLRAGEAASIVLLTATAKGMASCVVTEPFEIAHTREAVRATSFADHGYPHMLLRIGWAPPDAQTLPATPRRRLERVAEWASDDDQRDNG